MPESKIATISISTSSTSIPSTPSTSTSAPPLLSSIRTIDSILKTLGEMFEDRNYKIIPKAAWTKSNQQFKDLRMIGYDSLNPSHKIFVFFATDPKVPVKKIREYITHMDEQKTNHAIVVYANQLTSGAKTEISTDYDFEMFQDIELMKNKSRHSIVPKHEKLSESEVDQLMKTYNLTTKTNLPRMSPSDVIARYYHWKVGDVIRIHRQLGNQKEPDIYYRHIR